MSFAGGYFYSDAGIVATGRGGAFVAGADTQFAQYYNPAGLIRIKDPTINLGLSGVQQKVDFTRCQPTDDPMAAACSGDPAFFEPVSNQASPFVIPQIGFAMPFGKRIGFGFGFYSPFAPSSEYDPEGPQRYGVKETSIYQFSVGPSVAVKVHDTFTLGLGLQWKYLSITQSLDIVAPGLGTLDFQGQFDNPEDIGVSATVEDLFTPGFNAGLLFEPVKPLSIGLAVQPPTRFRARGEGTLDFTGTALEPLLAETIYTDDDVALEIQLPLVLRAGVAVRPISRLEIEAAVVYQRWSSLTDLLVDDIDIAVEPTDTGGALIPEEERQVDNSIALPTGFRDTVSLRLGAEARVHQALEVRAGGFWETGSLADEDISVSLMDPNKVQLGTGASVYLLDERLRIDGAAAILLFPDLEVRNSTVTQVDSGVRSPLDEDAAPIVVGNGNLSSRGWVLGIQAQWAFKAL